MLCFFSIILLALHSCISSSSSSSTRYFETKLDTPQNRNIPKWKNPVFSHIL